jgi:Family of unknown function (DUF6491)
MSKPRLGQIGVTLFAAASAALVACAAAPPAPPAPSASSSRGDDCFFTRSLRDWRPLDNSNLLLFTTGRTPYLVELFRPAMGLSFNVMIGVYDRDGRVCPYGGDAIIINGIMPERIPIRSMRRLTDDELDEIYVRFGIRPPVVVETVPAPGGDAPP